MIISRTLNLFRLHNFPRRNILQKKINNSLQNARGSHDMKLFYRKRPDILPVEKKKVEILTVLFWWWITWHIITDHDELLSYGIPKPSEWTDEDLGVPPLPE